jgi:catechol 2,3-dioxygenase-like lactoylglutathione lyase family enzyme
LPHEGFFAAHFFTVKRPGKIEGLLRPNSWREIDQAGQSLLHQAGESWIILNSGGGPTPDKPEVFLETPSDLNRVNSFLNLRVADIWACYNQWGDKGAFFLTEPLPNPDGWEWRCYMRDPDGYLIEVGQYTQLAIDWFNNHR